MSLQVKRAIWRQDPEAQPTTLSDFRRSLAGQSFQTLCYLPTLCTVQISYFTSLPLEWGPRNATSMERPREYAQ